MRSLMAVTVAAICSLVIRSGAGRPAQAGIGGQLADLDLGNPLADDGWVCPGVECHPVLSQFLIARADFSQRLTSSRAMASSCWRQGLRSRRYTGSGL
jgi:hypothetical protein